MKLEHLDRRRADLSESAELRALAKRLRSLVAPLLEQPLYYPTEKALLSRDGGVCPTDGSRLTFDPLDPWRHRCPTCGAIFGGERHHRAWVWRYHIWLSERAIHLALLGALWHEETLLKRAREIIDGYAERYASYPNADNVLGPTRPFFSTYLESIWLIQLITAATFVGLAAPGRLVPEENWGGFDDMVSESAGLIASFDEGWSNRQVWNNAALVAAGAWLARESASPMSEPLFDRGLNGTHGLLAQLTRCVGAEGLWYEGENYHFFALRGFSFAAEVLRGVGIDLYGHDAPAGRLSDMFVAPLLTALPDLTLPARGDAPYGVSLLQPRFAELWELGWARTGARVVESVLSRLYSAPAPVREDPGLAELAEQEQNRPEQRLDRTMLGWKALWCMNVAAPAAPDSLWQVGSRVLPEAGVAVIRPRPDRYVSLECGSGAGGHGHPDLLHLTLYWNRPCLADFGTGSYVAPSLHWYRSTLAHNAPGVAGAGQVAKQGWCAAFDCQGDWAWCRAEAVDLLGPGSRAIRTIVVGPSYSLDRLEIECDTDVEVDLPLHSLVAHETPAASRENLMDARGGIVDSGEEFRVLAGDEEVERVAASFGVLLERREGEKIVVARGPGPPSLRLADGAPLAFLIRRASGSGVWTQCWVPGDDAPTAVVTRGGETVLEFRDGSFDRIAVAARQCRISDRMGRRLRLQGPRDRPRRAPAPRMRPRSIICPLLDRVPSVGDWCEAVPRRAIVELGSGAYRKSELDYGAKGEFKARVAVFGVEDRLCFAADVVKRDIWFRRAGAPDPALDNEVADIHSDGLQLYADVDGWCGYLVIPDPDSGAVRVESTSDTVRQPFPATGEWARTRNGYRVLVQVALGRDLGKGERIPVAMVVNEMYQSRQRRAGQLALSSGGGWVYLRGDREHPAGAVVVEVT